MGTAGYCKRRQCRNVFSSVLTPLGGRPPGNKCRLCDTLHPYSPSTTAATTHAHTPSEWSKKIEERERKWAALEGFEVCGRESKGNVKRGAVFIPLLVSLVVLALSQNVGKLDFFKRHGQNFREKVPSLEKSLHSYFNNPK